MAVLRASSDMGTPLSSPLPEGERVASDSEPGEGRSEFQFWLREPLTPPSPLRGEGAQPHHITSGTNNSSGVTVRGERCCSWTYWPMAASAGRFGASP